MVELAAAAVAAALGALAARAAKTPAKVRVKADRNEAPRD